MTAGTRRVRVTTPALYLVVGGLSFVVDVGVLLLLHDGVGAPLWTATTAGYWTSVLVNYGLNRTVVFSSTTGGRRSAVRYGLLLLVNYLVTLVVVGGLVAVGVPVVVAKTLVVAGLAVANFFVYRAWVFA